MTLGITKLGTLTFSMKIYEIRYSVQWQSIDMLSLFVLSVVYVGCHYAEHRYAKCRYANRRYADSRGTSEAALSCLIRSLQSRLFHFNRKFSIFSNRHYP
jgi:hypothetical protein